MKRFIFLVASERSGSNFITSLMNGHRVVSGPPPTHLLRLFGTNGSNYGDLGLEKNWRTLIDDVVLNFTCKLGSWNTSLSAEQLLRRAGGRTTAEPIRLLYEEEARHDGASHVFVKENRTYRFADYLMDGFRGCQFVLLVRDPRDVASSWVRTPSIPGGVKEAVDTWLEDQEGGRELLSRLQPTGRIRLVRYEDLVTEPEASIADLLNFLGLPPDNKMLEFHRSERTQKNAARIQAWGNLARPILRDNKRNYVDVLTEDDVLYVELRCYELMRAFGYSTEKLGVSVSSRKREETVRALAPTISGGSYVIERDEERAIREQRLAAINTVLTRELGAARNPGR